MKRWLALALVLAAVAPAWGKGDKKSDKKAAKADKDKTDDATASDDSDDSDDTSDDSDDSEKPKKKAASKSASKSSGDDSATVTEDGSGEQEKPATNMLPAKQDLTGHDLGSAKKTNEFEKERFFVDKIDTRATEKGTLVQGSISSTSFAYTESGGNYGNMAGPDAATYSRLFTDLRLQTDFRHISASRWDARIDTRVRFVDTPAASVSSNFTPYYPAPHVQSGLTGQNEYELRELWLIRNGVRTDVIIGRQFIPDLAAIKIDGVRVDYAMSREFTLLGFGGLYPLRGSRSLSTDYIDLRDSNGKNLGQFIGAGGFGAAYRTELAYGSFGRVVLDPVQGGEVPRVFGTATGYWRLGSTLDLYHFAVVDFFGKNDALGAGSAGFTNLSGGANYKPNPRLRATASINRVDTETLNVQAQAFLSQPQPNTNNVVQNELFLKRLATTQLRGSVSAGLGDLQRFEVTVAMSYRMRPSFNLTAPDGMTTTPIKEASGAEVYGSFTDRRSIADMRLGFDFVRTFLDGDLAYSRSDVLALRAFAARELASGKGEWEAEVSYASTKDANTASGTGCTTIADCYGATTGTILSFGGTFYYRFNRDWLGIASAYLSDTSLKQMGNPADPTIIGLTGFGRIAYRF